MKFSFNFKFIRVIISIILSTHLCDVNAAPAYAGGDNKTVKDDIAMRRAIKNYLGYCAAQKNKNYKRDCYSLKTRISEWSDPKRKPNELEAAELNEMGASLTDELGLSKISVYYFYLKNKVPTSLFIPVFENSYNYFITHNKSEYSPVMRQMTAALPHTAAIRSDAMSLNDWENFKKREYVVYQGTGHWAFFKIFKKQGQVFFSYSAPRPYILIDQASGEQWPAETEEFVVNDEDALNITKFISEKKLSNICLTVPDDAVFEKFTPHDCQVLQGKNNYLKIENINTSRPIVVPIEFKNPSGWYFVGNYSLLKGE